MEVPLFLTCCGDRYVYNSRYVLSKNGLVDDINGNSFWRLWRTFGGYVGGNVVPGADRPR